MNLGRYAYREMIEPTFFSYKTNKPLFTLEYANSAENQWQSDQVTATGGKGGGTRVVFNSGKTSTLTLNTQIFPMQVLALYAGTNIDSGLKNIYKNEILTVQDDGTSLYVTLSKEAVDTDGDGTIGAADIGVALYENGIISTDPADAVTVGTFTAATRKLVLAGAATEGSQVRVFYQYKTTSTAHSITFSAKNFPEYVKIVGDTEMVDENEGSIAKAQLTYFKAKLQSNFTLRGANSGDPTELEMVFDILEAEVDGIPKMAELVMYED